MSGKNWMIINSIIKAASFMQIWGYIVIMRTWNHFKEASGMVMFR